MSWPMALLSRKLMRSLPGPLPDGSLAGAKERQEPKQNNRTRAVSPNLRWHYAGGGFLFLLTGLCAIIHKYGYTGIILKHQSKERNMPANKQIKKTTIEITQDQYFFLKEKALALQKQNKNASIVSIIRDLIEKDKKQYKKGI